VAAPYDFLIAQPTTIGAIHAITGGPRPLAHPWADVLRDQPADAFAAWCWRRPARDLYVPYVVGSGGVVARLNLSTVSRPRPGPPTVT
jgi:hypothetical protein